MSSFRTRLIAAGLAAQLAAALPGLAMADGVGAPVPAGSQIDRAQLVRLEQLLQRYVDEERIAGAVALVLKDGEPVFEKAVGWSDREQRRKISSDTIFRIASQTKALTSAAALMLVEEGRLALSNPVSKFIPAFASTTVATETDKGLVTIAANRPITIRDLLTHTSGYSYGVQPHIAKLYEAKGLGPGAGNGWYFADKSEPICESMERLATLPAVAQPGEAYVYGYSTDILGCVIERASGQSLEAFLRTRLIEPLGMKDTHFYLPAAERNRLATVYASRDDRAVRAPEGPRGQGHYVEGPRRSFSGGAGLLSTAKDYARFLEMIRNDGELEGRRYLSPRAVALMRTNQTGTLHSPDGGLGFGFGFQTVERYGAAGMEAPGAYGWSGAYGTVYRIEPQSGLTLLLMIQLTPNTTDLREKFFNAIYQAVR